MGDLNYRIHELDIDAEEVFTRCAAGDWEFLKSRDQLNCERASSTVFVGFEEGALTFAPTYKYQPGTEAYERRPDKRLRAPAW
jgi:phosphatidylinositol-bisphosphatase